MQNRFLLSFSLLLLLCSCGHRQPRVVEEMAQFRDTLIDRGTCWVCYFPPQCAVLETKMRYLDYESLEYELLQNQYDSILSLYVYYDTMDERYDLSKDVGGKSFTRYLLSDNIPQDEKKGYFIELNDEYNYEEYEELYTELYKSIVDFNNTPSVTDLMDYFKDIPTCVLHPEMDDCGELSGNVDSVDRPYFENRLSQLQAYVDKKAKKFPLEIIDYASCNEHQKSALYNHTGEMIDCYYSYIFQYRLVQQIALYCPYIELITDDISEDKMVAVAYWGYNHCDGSTYVFLKQNSGIYTVDILHGGYFDYDNVRHIDTNNIVGGEPIYSINYGGTNSIRYFYDGNKWHKTEI